MTSTTEVRFAQAPSAAAAATIHSLKAEFVSECLRIAALKCQHAADNLDIQQILNVDRDMRLAAQHMREAIASYRELRQAAP